MIDERWVLLGACLTLAGGIGYVVATLRGRAIPNRVTWAVWAIAPLIAFSAQINQGVGLRSIMTLMVGLNPLAVFIASLVSRHGRWELTRLDVVCGVLAVIGLVLWQITGTGDVAIAFSILADALAGVPTVVKAWKAPETEHWSGFAGGFASAAITLLTIDDWTFANWGFPVYILAICTLLLLLIVLRIGPRVRGRKALVRETAV